MACSFALPTALLVLFACYAAAFVPSTLPVTSRDIADKAGLCSLSMSAVGKGIPKVRTLGVAPKIEPAGKVNSAPTPQHFLSHFRTSLPPFSLCSKSHTGCVKFRTLRCQLTEYVARACAAARRRSARDR